MADSEQEQAPASEVRKAIDAANARRKASGESLIDRNFPSQGESKRAQEGSQSTTPGKDTPSRLYNQ